MARQHQAEELLHSGLYPSQIASKMGISVSSVIQYLRTRVGAGSLRLSDIYFSFPADKRAALQLAIEAEANHGKIDSRVLREQGLTREEFELFESLRNRRVFAGDMYEYVSAIELTVHRLVQTILQSEFESGEHGWWRKGIPSEIRQKCVARREDDDEPAAIPYAYTDLIDLSKIITKNWSIFRDQLPNEYSSNRKSLENDFVRLNRIRNAVMHPVKERKWTEDDFQFVKSLRERLLEANPI